MKKIKERDEKMAEEDNDNKLPHEVPKSLSPKIQFFIAIFCPCIVMKIAFSLQFFSIMRLDVQA